MKIAEQWDPSFHLKRWFTLDHSGCFFASCLATRRTVQFNQLLNAPCAEDFVEIDSVIEAAANDGAPVVFFWSGSNHTSDVVELLRLLSQLERWSVERVGWGDAPDDRGYFSVRWKTKTGSLSEVAGFAPLSEMSLTRRAPYLSLAVWGGGLPDAKPVGLADVPWNRGAVKDDRLWRPSVDLTTKMLAEFTTKQRSWLRRVAFSIPLADAEELDLPTRNAANAPPSKVPPASP